MCDSAGGGPTLTQLFRRVYCAPGGTVVDFDSRTEQLSSRFTCVSLHGILTKDIPVAHSLFPCFSAYDG